MKYKDFEDAFSAARLNKYKNACGGNTNKAFLGYDKDDLLFGLDVMPDAVMNKITQL
jgi:hypothetical protein